MVENEGDARSLIRDFSRALRHAKVVKDCQPIFAARIPILKIVDADTGVHMDISFNIADGFCAVKPVKQLVSKYNALKPLVLVLKAFLRQRDLNDTHIGGIGSFLLVVMTTAFLQYKRKEGKAALAKATLGETLLDFFEFYGELFNYRELGISIIGDGMLYRKQGRNDNLSVENPQDPYFDVGKPVKDFGTIAKNFLIARERIMKDQSYSLASILKPIEGAKRLKRHK